MNDAVMIELKRRLAESDQVDVSRYQFVDMDQVREAAGDLWPQLRERVFVATRSIIERRIAEDDLIVPCATGFLVIFTALSGDPAARLTTRIRDEMERFFLGEADLAGIGVDSASERLSIEEFRAALAAADTAPGGATGAFNPGAVRAAPIALADLAFHAAWDSRREAVASYFVRPRTFSERESGWRPDLSAQLARPDDRLAFDIKVLNQAAKALDAVLERGDRCALITPAGYASLSQPRTRSAYVTALAALPKEKRQLIWICLEGAPYDAPAAKLAETGRIVLSHSPHLFILAKLGAASLERYAGTGAGWIGAALPDRFTSATRADMERFIALAGRLKTKVFFDNCNDWESTRAASRSGANLIVGRATGILDAPAAPFPLSRARLLSKAA